MAIPATANQGGFEGRKLKLISKIADLKDEETLDLIEAIVSEGGEPVLTDEEIAMVEGRHVDFQNKPNDFITMAALKEKLKSL
jgi:hypothetical protein